MLRKISVIILIVFFLSFSFNLKLVDAAISVSVIYIPRYIPIDCTTGTTTPGDGTPIAVFVSVTGGTLTNNPHRIKSRVGFAPPLYPATDLTYAIWWANVGTTPYTWGIDTTAWASTWPFNVDSNGKWSGWIVTKVNRNSITGNANFDWSKSIYYQARVREGTSNRDSANISILPLNMSSTGSGTLGGWIEGYAYLGNDPAQNKIVVVKDLNNIIVGIYITEDNGVREGYTGSAGYFKIAAPAGCNYRIELWDPTTNTVYTNGVVENICVSAGQTTSGITINAIINNPPTLDWTGESGYENSGVEPEIGNITTNFEYRIKYLDQDNNPPQSGFPKVHILKDGFEINGSPFSMSEVDSLDTNYLDGKLYKFSITLSAGNYSYYFKAKDIYGIDATGDPTSLKSGPIVEGETIQPIIYDLSPPRFSSNYNKRPTISAKYFDPEPSSGIDISTIYLKLNNIDVTNNATKTETQITYTPSTDLSLGKHKVEIGVKDLSGNIKIVNFYFYIIEPLTTENFYFGVPHAHTSYSDGALTPADAFTYARDVAKIDFLVITDHSNWLDMNEWNDTLTQANNFTQNGVFVALRGFEYTHTTQGHINVFNTDTYVSRNDPNYDTLEEFYAWLKTQPNAIAQFNHPFTLDDFNGFAYDEVLDDIITLQEVGNGSPPYSYARLENAYIYALDKGWHVGATNGQDNHTNNWGYPPNNLTGIIANNLTKNDVLEAFKMMRTYSTEDRNLKLSFKANNYLMGSTIPVKRGENIQFEIYTYDPDSSDKIVLVEIITNGGHVLHSWTNNSQKFEKTFTITYQGGSCWYYLRVVEQDGDVGITSPIWTPPSDIDLKVISLSYSPKAIFPNKVVSLIATLKNYGLMSFSNLQVKFYEGDPRAGGILIDTKTVDLPSGIQLNISTNWIPLTSGLFTIYVVLEGPQEDPEHDNTQKITFRVLESLGKRILIDRYHKNDYTSTTGLYNLSEFADLLTYNGYEVIHTYQEITESLLFGVDLLVITYPQGGTGSRHLSDSEKQAIRNFVQNGGSLLFTAKSNYNEDPTRYNDFLTSLGLGININHDNIYDDINNYGYLWGVNLYNFPQTNSKICDGITKIRFFSGASLIKPDKTPLIPDPNNNIEILAYANQTSYNHDDTPSGVNRVGTGYYIYSYRSNPNGSNMPTMSIQTLPNGARVAVLGRAVFSNYELGNWVEGEAASNNEAFTLNLVDWLCKINRVIPIREARKDMDNNNVPDRLGERVTIRGVVTSGSGKFFDVIYLQDETGGITVFGSFPTDKIIPEGAILQVTGVIDQYNGDTELKFDDFYRDILWIGWTSVYEPKYFRTGDLNLEKNEGWLVKTEGYVTKIIDSSTCKIDDGSGEIIIFIDGYIGTLPEGLKIGDYLYVIGLSGEYSEGHRIRVRSETDISFVPIFYNINVSVLGNGKVLINPPTGPYNPYSQITLTATPSSGWYFIGWYGDINSKINPISINLTKNLSLTAIFVNCFFDKKTGAIVLLDLVSSSIPKWRVINPLIGYDTDWITFRRFKSTDISFFGEYADRRYHFVIDYKYNNRYTILFNDRLTNTTIRIKD